MLKYRYKLNATKELFFTLGGFKRVGGWCKPIRQGKKVSFPSRAAEPLVCRYGSAPLSGQKACWSLTKRPFYKNGNQGGTAKDISSLRLRQSNLGGFFYAIVSNKKQERVIGYEKH